MNFNKRKRKAVTMEQKLNELEHLDKDESVKRIDDGLGVGITNIEDWRRTRKTIQDFCTNINSVKVLSTCSTLKKTIEWNWWTIYYE